MKILTNTIELGKVLFYAAVVYALTYVALTIFGIVYVTVSLFVMKLFTPEPQHYPADVTCQIGYHGAVECN